MRVTVISVDALRAEPVNVYESIPALPIVTGQWPTLQQLELEHLRATMRRSAQNVAVAARLLGLPDAELRVKLIQCRSPILSHNRSALPA